MISLVNKTDDYLYFDVDYIDLDGVSDNDIDEVKYFKKKLLEDKRFYNYYMQCKSIDMLYKAGFFIEHDVELHLFENYFNKNFYRAEIDNVKENVVLISCGGFSPLHIGHIEKLNVAREYLMNNNYNVCGAILSPSHDNYVSNKRNGDAKMFVHDRVNEAEKLIQELNIDWIQVDLWEGAYVPISVNYTKVIDRIDYLLNKDEDIHIKPIFVFGEDNYAFRYAFQNDDMSICVTRTNEFTIPNEDNLHSKLNVVLCGNSKNFNLSSKKLRENGYKLLSPTITPYYELREDLGQSLDYLPINSDLIVELNEQLIGLLNKYVIGNPTILSIDVNEQLSAFNNFIQHKNYNVLSADLYLESKFKIDVSRKFNFLNGQVKSLSLIDRMGNKLQPLSLPLGDYLIVDDDIASGYTMSKIKELLPSNINIVGSMGLNDLVRDSNKSAFDIVDARDFFIGSKNGGLQCEIGNNVVRVPYLYPYINLFYRANINPNYFKQFTLDVLNLNLKLYSSYELKDLLVSDIVNNNWLITLGYSLNDSVVSVIKNEIDLLSKSFI